MSFWQKVVNIGTNETRHDTFPYTQPITLVVTGNSGDIEISTSTGTDIEVTLHSHGMNAAKQLADIQVRYDSESHRLEVSAPEAKWALLTSVDVTINAPAYMTINTTTAAGDIDIDATATTIHCHTTAGDIDVHGAAAQELTLTTTAGDIAVAHAARQNKFQSTAGDIEVAVGQPATVHAKTTAGDIEVTIARGFVTDVNASTLSGEISSDIQFGGTGPSDEPVTVVLELTTLSGDIQIKRK
jgi:DUF4097 and DUF4098 domain-containing protein YvlB